MASWWACPNGGRVSWCVLSGGGPAAACAGHHVPRLRGLHLLRAGRGHHPAGLRAVRSHQEHRHVLGLRHHEAQGQSAGSSPGAEVSNANADGERQNIAINVYI